MAGGSAAGWEEKNPPQEVSESRNGGRYVSLVIFLRLKVLAFRPTVVNVVDPLVALVVPIPIVEVVWTRTCLLVTLDYGRNIPRRRLREIVSVLWKLQKWARANALVKVFNVHSVCTIFAKRFNHFLSLFGPGVASLGYPGGS